MIAQERKPDLLQHMEHELNRHTQQQKDLLRMAASAPNSETRLELERDALKHADAAKGYEDGIAKLRKEWGLAG